MKWMYGLAATPALIAAATALSVPSVAQAPVDGAQVFNMCKGCHTLSTDGNSGIGPNLHGLYGRKAGSVPGYDYSPAMKKSGLTWDAATLDAFLAAPGKKVPGTKMPISVSDPVKRAALVAYLKTATAK
jgi:cytochrome c